MENLGSAQFDPDARKPSVRFVVVVDETKRQVWRIQDFPGVEPTSKVGVLTYFWGRKLHENERILTPLDPPLIRREHFAALGPLHRNLCRQKNFFCQKWVALSAMLLFTHDDRKKHIVVVKCEYTLNDTHTSSFCRLLVLVSLCFFSSIFFPQRWDVFMCWTFLCVGRFLQISLWSLYIYKTQYRFLPHRKLFAFQEMDILSL